MIYIFLILLALLLAIVNRIAYRSESWRSKVVLACLAFLLGPPFLGLLVPGVALAALLIPLALVRWKATPGGFLSFRPLSRAAALVSIGVTGVLIFEAERGYTRLRVLYPYESMEGRLPIPEKASRARSLAPDVMDRLTRLENQVGGGGIRAYRLKRLHEDAVNLFVNSAGFGMARMSPNPSKSNVAYGLPRDPVPPQPGPRIASLGSPGEWNSIPLGDDGPFGLLLEESVLDFTYPWGFGYAKDRRHVAGFQSHRFDHVPESSEPWKVQTLDLVGLLLHDEPRVYVSARLPGMDELRHAPTRPLEKFELIGLSTLQDGDDLSIVRMGDTVRMLGAIRSTEQCIACHGCERGDLLGAFTYTLRREVKEPIREPHRQGTGGSGSPPSTP